MRVFLDTNVIVSAVATRGICADLLTLVLAEHDLVIGETVLGELRQVLGRRLGVPKATIAELGEFLGQRASVVSTPEQVPRRGLEAADAAVLAEAAAGAEVLVTGDRQLLDLARPPLPILSPRELWDRLRGPR